MITLEYARKLYHYDKLEKDIECPYCGIELIMEPPDYTLGCSRDTQECPNCEHTFRVYIAGVPKFGACKCKQFVDEVIDNT